MLLAEARRIVAGAAYRWNTDIVFEAAPSRDNECDWCPVARWCDGRQRGANAPAAVGRDLDAEVPAGVDDDLPF